MTDIHAYPPGALVCVGFRECPSCHRPLGGDWQKVYEHVDNGEVDEVTFAGPVPPGPYYRLAIRDLNSDEVCCNPVVAQSEIRFAAAAPHDSRA